MWKCPEPKSQEGLLSLHAVGAGLDRGRNELCGVKHRLANGCRPLSADWHEDAGSRDGREPDLHVALLGEISDRRSRRNKARHRGEISRTNHNRARIAFWRFYFFHTLEGKLQVVTQPAVENFVRQLTGFGHNEIAGSPHAHDRAGDWIEDAAL